jgi:eukaryotic-like serine/threonine-protein kinase
VIDSKYALLRQLGSGAAGAVYEAEHLVVGKRVAVKVLDP